MKNEMEEKLCEVFCGIYYSYTKRETLKRIGTSFIENCRVNSLSGSCNCLQLPQYTIVRQSLNTVPCIQGDVADVSDLIIRINCTKNLCTCAQNIEKLQLHNVLGMQLDLEQQQMLNLTRIFDDCTQEQVKGLLCYMHIMAQILSDERTATTYVTYFDMLSDLFVQQKAIVAPKLRTCIEQPKYFDVFAHTEDIVKGITDPDLKLKYSILFKHIETVIVKLQGTVYVQPIEYNWFKFMYSISEVR